MEEGEVSVDGKTYKLPEPFFIIATQNPQESIGTFPLPESQLDRFLMKMSIGFPDREFERQILENKHTADINLLEPCLSIEELGKLQMQVDSIEVKPVIFDYVQDIIAESRSHLKEFLYERQKIS